MAKDKDYTVGHLIKLLQQYPPETLVSIEDMDGNAFYTNTIAEHLDGDTPSIEILIPIYISELAIEPEEESNVFINSGTVNVIGE